MAQRHQFRDYLAGLLAPSDRPKTFTALAGPEPLIQAQAAPVQQLQFSLSESCWDADLVTMRTLQLQLQDDDPLTASDADGALGIDDTDDRNDGCATDRVARQYLGKNEAGPALLSVALYPCAGVQHRVSAFQTSLTAPAKIVSSGRSLSPAKGTC